MSNSNNLADRMRAAALSIDRNITDYMGGDMVPLDTALIFLAEAREEALEQAADYFVQARKVSYTRGEIVDGLHALARTPEKK